MSLENNFLKIEATFQIPRENLELWQRVIGESGLSGTVSLQPLRLNSGENFYRLDSQGESVKSTVLPGCRAVALSGTFESLEAYAQFVQAVNKEERAELVRTNQARNSGRSSVA